MIVGYSKLFSHMEKADISSEITNKKIRLFFRMLLLSGCHKFHYRKMYWETTPNTFVLCKQGLIQCLVLSASIFFGISILIYKTNSRSSFPWLILFQQVDQIHRMIPCYETRSSK